jgi:hypothetical protein
MEAVHLNFKLVTKEVVADNSNSTRRNADGTSHNSGHRATASSFADPFIRFSSHDLTDGGAVIVSIVGSVWRGLTRHRCSTRRTDEGVMVASTKRAKNAGLAITGTRGTSLHGWSNVTSSQWRIASMQQHSGASCPSACPVCLCQSTMTRRKGV